MNECKDFAKCSAPLCPQDEKSTAVWYANEQICRNELFELERQIMKEIKKKCKNKDSYFTLQMVRALKVKNIRNGIEGLNPDKSSALDEERWISSRLKHKMMNINQKAIEVPSRQMASTGI